MMKWLTLQSNIINKSHQDIYHFTWINNAIKQILSNYQKAKYKADYYSTQSKESAKSQGIQNALKLWIWTQNLFKSEKEEKNKR